MLFKTDCNIIIIITRVGCCLSRMSNIRGKASSKSCDRIITLIVINTIVIMMGACTIKIIFVVIIRVACCLCMWCQITEATLPQSPANDHLHCHQHHCYHAGIMYHYDHHCRNHKSGVKYQSQLFLKNLQIITLIVINASFTKFPP